MVLQARLQIERPGALVLVNARPPLLLLPMLTRHRDHRESEGAHLRIGFALPDPRDRGRRRPSAGGFSVQPPAHARETEDVGRSSALADIVQSVAHGPRGDLLGSPSGFKR